jgi:hypothetical protein
MASVRAAGQENPICNRRSGISGVDLEVGLPSLGSLSQTRVQPWLAARLWPSWL